MSSLSVSGGREVSETRRARRTRRSQMTFSLWKRGSSAIAQLERISWKHSARLALFHTPSALSSPAGSRSSAVPGPRAARLIKSTANRCVRASESAMERAGLQSVEPMSNTLSVSVSSTLRRSSRFSCVLTARFYLTTTAVLEDQ